MEYYFKALIEFDPIKCNELNIDINKCYKVIDDFYTQKGVVKLDQGTYVAEKSRYADFLSMLIFADNQKWFKKVLSKYWAWEGDIENEECTLDVMEMWKKRRKI